jgi:ketosteroid isomerase-like protein
MLTIEDEDILRNFDRYLAQTSLTKEGAVGKDERKIDKEALRAAFSDGYVFLAPSGRSLNPDDLFEYADEGDLKVDSKQTIIKELRSDETGDTAWMTGTIVLKASMSGKDISGTFSSSSVFVKRNGQWKQVLLHLSRDSVPAPTPGS